MPIRPHAQKNQIEARELSLLQRKKFAQRLLIRQSGGVRIGENVALQENSKKEVVPMFQYFKYATVAGSAEAGAPIDTLTPMALASGAELTATTAGEVAAVQVSFTARPTDNAKTLGRVADFSNQVTFAFSAPNPEATIDDGPCQ